MAIRSSKRLGFRLRRCFFMPGDSNWNSPVVSPPAVEVVGQRIVKGDRVDVGAGCRVVDSMFSSGILDDRQRRETQKVHLDQADALDLLALVLHDVQLGVLRYGHRSELLQIVLSDNHAAGVHAGLAHGALEFLCVLHRVADQRIVRLLFLYQLGNFLVGLRRKWSRAFRVPASRCGCSPRGAASVRGRRP